MTTEPIKLLDIVRYWHNQAHQVKAVSQLDALIAQYIPKERLLAVTQVWRQPPPAVPPSGPSEQQRFQKALDFTLRWEGGWSAHPSDPGGATMRGVTQATYDRFRQQQKLACRSVRQISDSELQDIYRHHYWQPSHACEMVLPLAVVQFDTAVNFGVGGACKLLQRCLQQPADGLYGAQTAAALADHNTKSTALAYVEQRIAFRHRRVRSRPSQSVFLSGWLNRDRDLKAFVSQL